MSADDEAVLRLLSVSWPRAVEIQEGRWSSAPAWDAPIMPRLPAWHFQVPGDGGGDALHVLDWNELFQVDLHATGQPTGGEMRGFHVVFRVRVQRAGLLVFYDTDGSIVRRNGEVVHEERGPRPLLRRHELAVRAGEHLDIAQWHSRGRWIWGARCEPDADAREGLVRDLESYGASVEEALTRPEGPTLKVYTDASQPVRCALAIYSLVLNGYRPAGIQVFGDYQWSQNTRQIMQRLLPFADIVATSRVESTLDSLDARLVPLARSLWGAMKICVGLFFPPREYCFLDDDIFVLDRVHDALQLYQDHAFVYAPDNDYTERYAALLHPKRDEQPARPALRSVSTGFYLMRNSADLQAQSQRLLSTPREGHLDWIWEQGVFAWEFSRDTAAILPTERYLVPFFDGLPRGLHGYDWAANPCEFVCVHFGGPTPKPTDEDAGALLHEILGRQRTRHDRRRDPAVTYGPARTARRREPAAARGIRAYNERFPDSGV